MYTVNNQAVTQKIESSGRVFGIWLEDTANGALITGDIVFGAAGEASSTSLSDDIDLGAVCAQSWTVNVTGADESFVGREYKLYFYLKDFANSRATYGDLKIYGFGRLAKMTCSRVKTLGEIMCGELIPMGTFTCVKAPRFFCSRGQLMSIATTYRSRRHLPTDFLNRQALAVAFTLPHLIGAQILF